MEIAPQHNTVAAAGWLAGRRKYIGMCFPCNIHAISTAAQTRARHATRNSEHRHSGNVPVTWAIAAALAELSDCGCF